MIPIVIAMWVKSGYQRACGEHFSNLKSHICSFMMIKMIKPNLHILYSIIIIIKKKKNTTINNILKQATWHTHTVQNIIVESVLLYLSVPLMLLCLLLACLMILELHSVQFGFTHSILMVEMESSVVYPAARKLFLYWLILMESSQSPMEMKRG